MQYSLLNLLFLSAFLSTFSWSDGNMGSSAFQKLKKDVYSSLKAGNLQSAKDALADLAADESPRAVDLFLDLMEKVPQASFQRACLNALARCARGDALADITERLAKKKGKWQDRVTLCDALGELSDLDSLLALCAGLEDKKDTVVRAALISLRRRQQKGSVAAIIDLLEEVEADKGVIHGLARGFLEEFTGEEFETAADWRNWWRTVEDDFVRPKEPRRAREVRTPAAGTVSRNPEFFGTEITSKRVVFIIDVSGSMQQVDPAGRETTGSISEPQRKRLDAFGLNDRPQTRMRIDRARYELQKVVALLQGDVRFTIIAYHGRATMGADGKILKKNDKNNPWLFVWKTSLTRASDKNKRSAMAFVQNFQADGATFTNSALEVAFKIPDADTICLLSDGIPTEPAENGGSITTQDILDHVLTWNRLRKLIIHSFGFEGDNMGRMAGTEDFSEFLEDLATQNGGSYRAIE